MKIGEIIEEYGMKYIAQKEIFGCEDCYFEERINPNCYNKFGCKSQDKVILIKIPLELLEKIEQLENQIEQMKNCENCENANFDENCKKCINYSSWGFKK